MLDGIGTININELQNKIAVVIGTETIFQAGRYHNKFETSVVFLTQSQI
jgi:hypothetical protein